MSNYLPSLEERKLRMFEDVCATCGDDGGSDSSAAVASDEPETRSRTTLEGFEDVEEEKEEDCYRGC